MLLMIAFVAISTPALADGGDSDGESEGTIVPVNPKDEDTKPGKRHLEILPEVRISDYSLIYVRTDFDSKVAVKIEDEMGAVYSNIDENMFRSHIFELESPLQIDVFYTITLIVDGQTFVGWFEL